jgi:hypothetical protein
MQKTKTYYNFPLSIIIISNLVSVLIYFSGFIIMLGLNLIAAVLYLFLILAFEYRLISKHCVNCYYWGKLCGFGKGMLSSFLFKRGNPSKFCEKQMTWKDLIPDFLVSLIPLIIGIALIIIKFNYALLIAVIILVLLTTAGNGLIRSNLTCKYCKQRETGCPAEQLFNKDKSAD